MLTKQISRRDFLKTSGALVVTYALAPKAANAAIDPNDLGPKTVAADRVDGFVAIDSRGVVTVYCGKVDLGPGTDTALTQIAAEELGVPMQRVKLVTGDTLLTPDQGPTFGSLTIQNGGVQIRQACATAREALLDRAAQKLGVSRSDLAVQDGWIRGNGKRVAYAELVGDRRLELKVDAKAPLKDPSAYTIVGKPVPRLDIPEKVTGRFTYMQDLKVKGMVHARVVRPPAMRATLEDWSDAQCKQIPGYLGAVRKGSFLAVVAHDEWAAIKAARAIEARWSKWEGLPDKAKLWDHVRATRVAKDEVLQNAGDSAAALGAAPKLLKASYDFAVHTHGSIGPSCAVAQFKDGKLTAWSASQATHLLRKQLARMLDMSELNIRCLYVEGSGCYGRNGHEDAAADAALIAREVGRPVRVQWSRADEHGWDPHPGPHAEQLRQRVLPRRARCGRRGRSVRIPRAQSERSARPGIDGEAAQARGVDAAHRACRRRGGGREGARSVVRQVRARANVRRRRGRCRGEPAHRQGPRRALLCGARLRPEHPPRRAAQPESRQHHPDGEPRADRGPAVEPVRRDQRRLAKLSHPAVPGTTRDHHRSHRPAEGTAVGRRRADRGSRAFGDRQRGFRRCRRAAALGAFHTGKGARGAQRIKCRAWATEQSLAHQRFAMQRGARRRRAETFGASRVARNSLGRMDIPMLARRLHAVTGLRFSEPAKMDTNTQAQGFLVGIRQILIH